MWKTNGEIYFGMIAPACKALNLFLIVDGLWIVPVRRSFNETYQLRELYRVKGDVMIIIYFKTI